MVELVTVILILGILAAVAIPRFVGTTVFTQRGFADEARAALRYAQKIAIAQRREVCVDFTASRITLSRNPSPTAGAACSVALARPGQDSAFILEAPAGTTISASGNFRFNGLGQPVPGAVTVGLSGLAQPLTIAAETGHVSD